MTSTELLIVLITVGFVLYKIFTRNFDYWKNKNVPHVKPIPFFGNFYEIATFHTTIGFYLAKLYHQFKTPYFGIYAFNKPILVIRSPKLIKSIFVKDFNYFYNRTILSNEKCDSLVSNILFVLHNPNWRIVRSKMTPAFTTAKIKGMLELINHVSIEMNCYLEKHASKDSMEAKEVCSKYSTDVIATCAFGIQAGSFENENAEFRTVGRKIFDFNLETVIRQMSYIMIPGVVKIFKFRALKDEIAEFFREVFWKTVNLREGTNSKRNDLIDIIVEMKKQPDDTFDFTGDRVVAQAFMFFTAGFETTSATMAFALYEMCLSSKIQNKAREEIKEVLSKYGGFTYDAIQDMKYLHMIFCETLRKYPVLPFLDRVCMEDYKLPDSDLIIEKGTFIYISMFGMHWDPEVYPDPEKFDPERFSDDNKRNLPSFSYIPFGEGPRGCIGERFGLLVGKLGLARILSEYVLEKSLDTPVPLEFTVRSLLLASKVGLPLKFKKIVPDVA